MLSVASSPDVTTAGSSRDLRLETSERASRYHGLRLRSALLTDRQREISILSETEMNGMLKLINRVYPLAALDFWVYTGSSLTLTCMRYLCDWQWFILISVNKVFKKEMLHKCRFYIMIITTGPYFSTSPWHLFYLGNKKVHSNHYCN